MSIVDLMKQRLDTFTQAQRKAADYIIRNIVQTAFSTVDNLSHQIGVSTNSIVRLARDLGYSGYSEFQSALQDVVIAQETPLVKLKAWSGHRTEEMSLINEVRTVQLKCMEETAHNLSPDMVYAAAKLLIKARKIFVVGGRTSYGIAYFLMHNLDRLMGKSYLIGENENSLPEEIRRVTNKDVLVVINMPRYLNKTLRIATALKERGAKIITITDGFASPYRRFSDILFIAAYKSISFFNSMVASLMIVEILISVIADMVADQSKDLMEDAEQISKKFSMHPL